MGVARRGPESSLGDFGFVYATIKAPTDEIDESEEFRKERIPGFVFQGVFQTTVEFA